jgi:hypothetical protein
MPLAPHRVPFGRVSEQLRLKVREALEVARPVLADLLFTAEAPVGMSGLLAAIACIEALQECFDVVLVNRLM